MTPAARIQSSIELLDTILSGVPTEQALTRWARSNRFAGSKDRAAIRDHVFSAIRCRNSFALLGGEHTGRGLMIGAIISAKENVDEAFNGIGYGPEALSEDERGSLRTLESLSDDERTDMPDWIWKKLQEDLGDEAIQAAEYLRHRAPVFLRVNLRKCDVETAITLLKEDEIEAEIHELSATALQVVKNPRRVAQSRAYKDGYVELQDVASQAVCDFLSLPNSGKILDFCAGGGGKSLAIAAKSDANIFAHDANILRMKDLPERGAKASTSIKILENTPIEERFDLVLCDVPCSGSGSWRRSPDGKWNLTETSLDDLNETQANILEEASSLVLDGGELAYATCSVFHCENRALVDAFVANNSEWRVIEDHQFLPQDGGDGFYIARLTRV